MLHTMGWLVSAKRLTKKIILIYFVIQSTFNIFEFQIVFEILIMIKMETKTFSVVTSISMVLALTVVVLSIIGIAITGFYPGMIVFMFIALIPIASKFYAKKIMGRSNDFQRNYYTTLTIINLLSILVVLWMTWVIVHDRVLQDCC